MNDAPRGSSSAIARLVESFHRLPGIGPKSAQRLAYHVLRAPEEEARSLAEALLDVKQRAVLCAECQQISDSDPCAICDDSQRDRTMICVVEEPLDLVAIERTGGFDGVYHVLHGVISPADGVGPEDLKIAELLARLRTPPRRWPRGRAPPRPRAPSSRSSSPRTPTSRVRRRRCTSRGCSSRSACASPRLARGLPAGADLEYADNVTLERALAFRQAVE